MAALGFLSGLLFIIILARHRRAHSMPCPGRSPRSTRRGCRHRRAHSIQVQAGRSHGTADSPSFRARGDGEGLGAGSRGSACGDHISFRRLEKHGAQSQPAPFPPITAPRGIQQGKSPRNPQRPINHAGTSTGQSTAPSSEGGTYMRGQLAGLWWV